MRTVRWRAMVAPAAVLAGLLAAAPAAATPVPTVTGPLPVTAGSYPFGAADHEQVPEDLAASGYVEDEYLVSGTASVYDWPQSGPAVVRTANAPYATRMLVRRPAKRTRLSGNVVVEMLNPSNLYDLNIGWALMHKQLIHDGDVWVGITAKPVTVRSLQAFDPQRYASLSFANPLPLDDPRNCTDIQASVDPPAERSRTAETGLIWDVYSQVGAWLKSTDPANPLAHGAGARRRSAVDHLYGFGYSQTGGYLVDYINAIHPLVVQADGRPMYDGYIVGVAGGNFVGAVPINQCSPTPRVPDPRLQIHDVGVPVIRIMSQSDYIRALEARRPDGDTPPDLVRHYEMAGAAHATPDELYFSARAQDIVKAGRAVPPPSCNEGPRSRFPSSIHFDAALQNLDLWVRDGLAPPHADPILVQGTGSDATPVLDEFGNVQGGLRSPFVDVPTSTWFGNSTGPSFCSIAGHEVPLDQATLDELYPTEGAYVRAVQRRVRELVADRFLTREDGKELVREAEQTDVTGGRE